MAALIAGDFGRRVVFLHTGGLPGIFGHPAL
jgi:D-cysteine desulfhydrase